MKKKSRRSGPGEKASQGEPAQDEKAGSGSLSDPGSARSEDGKPSSSGAKKSLPAFGFAADLLKNAGSKAAPESSPEPTPAAPSLDLTTHADLASVDAHAPTRVFDFADTLNDGGRRAQEQAAPVKIGTFVAFDLAGETYAMPVEPVRQVVRVSTITRVPHAPRPIRGVTNLRGRVIPVIDLRLRIGLPQTDINRASRVMSVSSRGRLIGLLVDAVHQVVHLDLFKVQPPPDDVMTLQSDYIEGVYGEGDDLILLLDIDKALIIREAGAA